MAAVPPAASAPSGDAVREESDSRYGNLIEVTGYGWANRCVRAGPLKTG